MLHIKSISCVQKDLFKIIFPHYDYGSYSLLKPDDRKYLPFSCLDPRCMVGRIYEITICVSHGFREDFFYSFPHFKSIEAYDSMSSIDIRSMDVRIYVGDHKVRKRAKIRN